MGCSGLHSHTNTAFSVSSSRFKRSICFSLSFSCFSFSPSLCPPSLPPLLSYLPVPLPLLCLSLSFFPLSLSLWFCLFISSYSFPSPPSLSQFFIHFYICCHFLSLVCPFSLCLYDSVCLFFLPLSCPHLSVSMCLLHYPYLQVQPSRSTDGVPHPVLDWLTP